MGWRELTDGAEVLSIESHSPEAPPPRDSASAVSPSPASARRPLSSLRLDASELLRRTSIRGEMSACRRWRPTSVVVVFELMPNGQDEDGTDRNLVQGHVPSGAKGDDQLSAGEARTCLAKEE